MPINLELPKKFKLLTTQANQVATEVMRANSRKYDLAEHTYPKELDMLAALIDGMNDGGDLGGTGAAGVRRTENGDGGNRNGSNMSTVLGVIEMCWGDVGLTLSMPRQGLGNSAIASVASAEQEERYDGMWVAMAITEPEAGSDSAAIRTTAKLRRGKGRVRPERREDLRHRRRARRCAGRLGLARPVAGSRRDQVVRGRALEPGPEARAPRPQARDQGIRHRDLHPLRLPRPGRGPARHP